MGRREGAVLLMQKRLCGQKRHLSVARKWLEGQRGGAWGSDLLRKSWVRLGGPPSRTQRGSETCQDHRAYGISTARFDPSTSWKCSGQWVASA